MLECEHDHGDATRDDTIMMPVTNTTLATSDSVLETSALHVIRTSILTNIQEKHLSYSNSAFILTFLLSFTTGALPIFLQDRIIFDERDLKRILQNIFICYSKEELISQRLQRARQ